MFASHKCNQLLKEKIEQDMQKGQDSCDWDVI